MKNFLAAVEETKRKIATASLEELAEGYDAWIATVRLIGRAASIREIEIDEARWSLASLRARRLSGR
jgi:hypothetical protein